MIARAGGRKFLVVMFALVAGVAIAFLCDAAVLSAYATLAGICVASFNAAHASADWKNPKPGDVNA